MASSLIASCTVLSTTNPRHRIASTNNIARRSRRFHVSCNAAHDKEGRVDRRNMLLGLGGLYGATNLILPDLNAYADPIQPPEFKSCGAAHEFKTGDPLDVNCCPPVSIADIVDYKLPTVTKLRRRQPAHRLSQSNIAKYEEAMRLMRELDVTDPDDPRGFTQQANIHCAYCNGAHDQLGFPGLDLSVHYSWIFFPFHRWYLYFYERILGSLIGDPDFALPFWNWDNPKGMQLPAIFDNPDSPLYDANRNQDHRPPAIANLARSDITDPVQTISENLAVMYNEMIGGVNSATDFMGQPYKAGDEVPETGMGGTSERGSHISIHAWVGDPRNQYNEDLGNFYSAGRDTAFYAHHSNVDRMWTIWQKIQSDYPKTISDPDYLNASFLFYDENKRLVRVAAGDCTDNTALGYEYEKVDIPWLNYRPLKNAEPVKTKDIVRGALGSEKVFPVSLTKTVRVLVPKPSKGNADDLLVLEGIQTDSTKPVKFDVFVNDEADEPNELDKPEYAGTYAQLPHRVHAGKGKGSLRLILKELYENIDIGDQDSVVVTIVPRINGKDVTIGGVKIVPAQR